MFQVVKAPISYWYDMIAIHKNTLRWLEYGDFRESWNR